MLNKSNNAIPPMQQCRHTFQRQWLAVPTVQVHFQSLQDDATPSAKNKVCYQLFTVTKFSFHFIYLLGSAA